MCFGVPEVAWVRWDFGLRLSVYSICSGIGVQFDDSVGKHNKRLDDDELTIGFIRCDVKSRFNGSRSGQAPKIS